MSDSFIKIAPTIGLVFFFITFLGIAIWALKPSNKQKIEAYGKIPLKEDDHG